MVLERVRAPGAGPKRVAETQPGLVEVLDELVHPETRGNPMSLLRWTSKSVPHLTKEPARSRLSDLRGHGRPAAQVDGVFAAKPGRGEGGNVPSGPRRPVPLP